MQGVTTTIGQRDSPVYDSLDVSIDLKEDDNNEEPVEEPKMSRIMKRPKSLPVQRAYTSFVAATPVPETNNKPAKLGEQNEQKENARTQSINEIKSRLQTALAILPDSKTHWETTIENLHNVNQAMFLKIHRLNNDSDSRHCQESYKANDAQSRGIH